REEVPAIGRRRDGPDRADVTDESAFRLAGFRVDQGDVAEVASDDEAVPVDPGRCPPKPAERVRVDLRDDLAAPLDQELRSTALHDLEVVERQGANLEVTGRLSCLESLQVERVGPRPVVVDSRRPVAVGLVTPGDGCAVGPPAGAPLAGPLGAKLVDLLAIGGPPDSDVRRIEARRGRELSIGGYSRAAEWIPRLVEGRPRLAAGQVEDNRPNLETLVPGVEGGAVLRRS